MKTQNSPLSQVVGNSTQSRLPVERSIRLIAGIAIVWLVLLASLAVSRAASGTWTNDASSVWSATTNWLNGTVADGSGSIADFTMNNVKTNTVMLDASHSLGALLFGAAGGTTNNLWRLNATNNSVLTLAGGTPTIAVSNSAFNNVATLALPVAGASGLTKVGSGVLNVAGQNTYSGNTTVSGGTLQLGLSAQDPLLYMSFDSVSGNTVINQGVGGTALNGLITGATIVPGVGPHGNAALSIPAGASSAAYVLVNNNVVPFTGNASWTVAWWFQTTTPGAAFLNQGSGGWGTGNTTFYLNNGGGGGLGVGGVRNSSGWEAGTSTTIPTNGLWHHFAMTCSTAGTKVMYLDGVVEPFNVNQWGTSTGQGNSIRIGGTGTGQGDGQVGLAGYLDDVYIFNRTLSQAEVQTLMNQVSGPVAYGSPVPTTSPVFVAPQTTLDLNGFSAVLSGLTGTGLVNDSAAAAATLTLNINANNQFDGVITNSNGALSVTKNGNGTLTLPTTNSYRGATVVNGGTVNITGSLQPSDNGGTANTFTVNGGVVNFSGPILTNYNFNIGPSTNQNAAFYQTAGLLKQVQGGNGANFQLGTGVGGYGYYYIAAGASNIVNEIGIGGEGNPSGNGQMDVYGIVNDTGWITLTRGTTGNTAGLPSTGILNLYPGSTTYFAGGGLVCNWSSSGGAQTAVINGLGGNVFNQPGSFTINLNNGGAGGTANVGILNLNGGIIQASSISGNASGTNRVNFQGGTLMASGNNGGYMSAARATVYSAGGTLNNNANNITLAQKLTAPSGNGEQSITSFTGGTNYIAPPIVLVVRDPGDTTGVGATAIAQINPVTGVVTNVLITSPGDNYTATPTFVLLGGNPTTAATITGTAPTANAQGGGMTFTGTGVTTLNGGYSYTGPTLVLGGTLGVVASNVTPAVAGNVTVSNGALSVVVNSGATWPMNNLVTTVSNTINLSYGLIPASPTVAAITLNGGYTPAPTNIINISAFGMGTGQFPLIKYTTGTLSLGDFSNFGLLLPPGVTATLVNNTGNKSIDLNVASAPIQLTWNGVNGTSWDTTTLNWTNAATGTIVAYQEHTAGGVVSGDIVNFDDTFYQGGSPWPTNVNLTGQLRPFPISVNNTQPYTIGGSGGINGSAGTTGFNFLTKNNTGSLTLLTSNTFTGNIVLNGGTTIITNDSAFGASANVVALNGGALQVNGNTTNNARAFTASVNATIGVATNVTAQFGGNINASGQLTKTDNGTLVLGGVNVLGGTLNATQGTLILTASNRVPARANVGSTANGQLIVNGGTFQSTGGDPSIMEGDVSGAAGRFVLNSGFLLASSELYIGTVGGGYGAIDINGGTAIVGSWFCLSRSGGIGVLNMTGGSVNVTGNNLTIGTIAGTGNNALANISGGNFVVTNGGIYVGEITPGVLNISGNATVTPMGTLGVSFGNNNATQSGILNLNGGTLSTPVVARRGGTVEVFNFNGGTLKARVSTGTFMQGLSGAKVYGGGAIIDDGGFSITIAQPLFGVTNGSGIATLPMDPTVPSSGYIDTPIVTITDLNGIGSNAMATATVSNGQVTAVNVICPGSGYDSFNSYMQVTFSGGGANPIAPSVNWFDVTFAPVAIGGLTKNGSGTVTLTGVNTIAGPITNNAGRLSLNSASTYASAVVNGGTLAMNTASTITGPTTVNNGGAFTVAQSGSATITNGDLTLNGGAALPGATLGLGVTGLNPTVALLNCGALTLNGTNTVSVSGGLKPGPNPIVKYVGAIGGSGIANAGLILPQGFTGVLSNSVPGSTVYVVVTSTGPGLVWSGTNTQTTASTNLWDIVTTTNWWLGATATSYQQPIIPGDAVTFNDTGSGVVVLNTNAGPSSLVISNNNISYTFRGTGSLTGPGGITKLGTGTVNMNLTNNTYTGDTVISNGTLSLGSASAVSSLANLNLGPNGILELNGRSQTVNTLSGSGTIDNNSSANLTFTVNNGGNWGGTIHDQGAGGGIQLTKNNYNTLVISGTNILSTTANPNAQYIAGMVIITNNGLVNCSGGQEYWIAPTGGFAVTNIVDGGTLLVNSWLCVGRGAATCFGTLIVNNGLVQKAGGNNIVLGSLAAQGVMIINGGQVLNNGEIFLGESLAGSGNIYLNGGLLQAVDIHPNNYPDGYPSSVCAVHFNGGTMQASGNNGNYLRTPGIYLVSSNGFVLDDNGFTLSIGSGTIIQPDGTSTAGLFKKGSGQVYLDTANTYTGLTVVTNGTLAGVGSIVGSALSTSTGLIGAGDAATNGIFTIGGNLTVQGGATVRINKTAGVITNDQIVVTGTIAFGGVLYVNNITGDGTPLVIGDTFLVFNKGGSGNFTGVVGLNGGTYSFNPATGVVTVTGLGPGTFTNPTRITSFTLNGANVVITGTSGQSGDAYYLLQSTNVALPLGQWKVVATNVLGANGNFTFTGTNVVIPGNSQQFYLLSNTNSNH